MTSPPPITGMFPKLTSGSLADSLIGSQPAAVQGQDMDQFRTLMTLMMLSSLSGGMGSSAGGLGAASGMGSAAGMGMDMNALMAPLMLSLLEKMMAQQVETPQPQALSVAKEPLVEQNTPRGMPISGGRLTQASHTGHVALDFGAPLGTPVKATLSGKVVHAGWNNEGYGKLVIIQNGPYRVYFAHLSKIPVQVGDTVQFGDVIGKSGNTGNSTGPHLHYEVRKNGVPINPSGFTLKK